MDQLRDKHKKVTFVASIPFNNNHSIFWGWDKLHYYFHEDITSFIKNKQFTQILIFNEEHTTYTFCFNQWVAPSYNSPICQALLPFSYEEFSTLNIYRTQSMFKLTHNFQSLWNCVRSCHINYVGSLLFYKKKKINIKYLFWCRRATKVRVCLIVNNITSVTDKMVFFHAFY